jgi:hypothetical protein
MKPGNSLPNAPYPVSVNVPFFCHAGRIPENFHLRLTGNLHCISETLHAFLQFCQTFIHHSTPVARVLRPPQNPQRAEGDQTETHQRLMSFATPGYHLPFLSKLE